MIGLGSNRLTLARRGGMSVTQAGRGGMEWLAGGRVPSWSSPYSRQAGEALKAQFPTQWPTIRDYGFAHPEIVGYMNAYAPEDAKIAYSLVEGIGWRYVEGNNSGYFNTGLNPVANHNIDYKFRTKNYPRNSDCAVHLIAHASWAYDSFALFTRSRNKKIAYHGQENVFMDFKENNRYQFVTDYSAGKGTVTNLTSGETRTLTLDLNPSSQNGLKVLGFADTSRCSTVCCEHLKIDSGVTGWFIPFKRNGQMELLDLVSGNLATRVGTFTELITS